MGIVDILQDIIESGKSLLLMGRPGLGKTTLLREMARVLADDVGKRVVIVDTSNEIAGDGDVPHPAIGRARRMQVAQVSQQHDVMIEAVENHMPEVVVIDEIGRVEEALAARTIAERGVQLIATVHGNTLDNLLANPAMSDLIGGIQAVTLSDEEARRRGTQKTVLERKAPPTFDVVVEMIERDRIAVRHPVADVVDALLRGQEAEPEVRWRDENGDVQSEGGAFKPQSEYSDRFGNHNNEGHRWNERPRKKARGERPAQRGRNDRRGRSPEQALPETADADWHFELPRNGRGSQSRARDAYEQALLDRAADNGPLNGHNGHQNGVAQNGVSQNGAADDDWENEVYDADLVARETTEAIADDEADETPRLRPDGPVDMSRVRRVYPFGVSRSRLTRAVKHLGLPLDVARTPHEADAVLMLTGADGIPIDSTLLKAPREMGLPIIGVAGNTYAHVVTRLNDLYEGQNNTSGISARDLAMREAHAAAQRVLAEAEPVELRPQSRTLRRVQHQLAQRFHLRSYSVGREPNRRVRFLPSIGR
jgi:nucleoside-triphosphatase THEP1